MISADTLNNLQVNNLLLFEPIMKQYFANKVQSFKGGQLAHFLDKWKELTSDSEVLNCVKGQFIEFSTQPTKNLGPKRKTFSISDSLVIENCLTKVSLYPPNMKVGNMFRQFLWQIKKVDHIE